MDINSTIIATLVAFIFGLVSGIRLVRPGA